MNSINEVSVEQISMLNDIQLTRLLDGLLKNEAFAHKLPNCKHFVPLNITSKDGGIDGGITWVDGPEKTHRLENRNTGFQIKATDLFPSGCANEILESPNKLKPEIKALVTSNGCYVLFTNKQLNQQSQKARIAAFRKAIEDAGYSNHSIFEILVYDAHLIRDWVNDYIGVVKMVQYFCGISRPDSFCSFEEWEQLIKPWKTDFQIDEKVTANIELIKLCIEKNYTLRVYGHSGIGKTRLVFEGIKRLGFGGQIAYLDLAGGTNISNIREFFIANQLSKSGIIIIDNCDKETHSILSSSLFENGHLKLITIGFDISPSFRDKEIKLERDQQRDLVRKIVKVKLPNSIRNEDAEYISRLSEGYPWMAIRFCEEVIEQGLIEINKIPVDDFIQKLIFGSTPENEVERDIIRACSVFSAFGFLDDTIIDVLNPDLRGSLKRQMDFIRTEVYDGEITETKFKAICQKYREKDIIERRGTYYLVKPTKLAIELAASWLIDTPHDRIIGIIKKLQKVNLERHFIERLSDLDQIDKAKDIVGELWAPNRPFGSAEVLNSTWGSLLFRYVVEVNPRSTVNALENAFGSYSIEQLLEIKEGRRNLVWALEKLCFRKETFRKAAKILFSFAVAENEKWGNNATNQFLQLFKVVLPGTEVNFQERIKVIKWGLSKDEYCELATMAMAKALINEGFFRMRGSENQGSSAPLKDYIPSSTLEIIDYWSQVIDLLTQIATSNNSASDFARDVVARGISTLIKEGQFDLVNKVLEQIILVKGGIWPEALKNLKFSLNVYKDLPQNVVLEIEKRIEELTPSGIKEQLSWIVSVPEWKSYEKDKDGNKIKTPQENAEKLAERIIKENIPWIEHIESLLEGEQREAFSFGKRLAELNYDRKNFIDTVLATLEKIPKEKQNSGILSGFVYGTNDKQELKKLVNRIIDNPKLHHLAFYLTRTNNPDIEDLMKLFVLIDKYDFSIFLFKNFEYGNTIPQLSEKNLNKFIDRLCSYEKSGKWVALSILYRNFRVVLNLWKKHEKKIKSIILSDNLLFGVPESNQINFHIWANSIEKILETEKTNDFPIRIARQIVEYSRQPVNSISADDDIKFIAGLLLKNSFNTIWEIFAEALLGEYMLSFQIKNLIGFKGNLFGGGQSHLLEKDQNIDTILKWCARYPEIAPIKIIEIAPINVKTNESNEWHPLTRALLNEFGDNEELLMKLGSNMRSFGITGSVVPYYEMLNQLLKELTDHEIDRVAAWAEGQFEYFKKEIKREKLEDEQRGF
ncbi:MAG: hypothetical protein R8P61_33065 [Bacteroidia bacterium]|nr:hypothetical protein [Bacteroidia bacterium]